MTRNCRATTPPHCRRKEERKKERFLSNLSLFPLLPYSPSSFDFTHLIRSFQPMAAHSNNPPKTQISFAGTFASSAFAACFAEVSLFSSVSLLYFLLLLSLSLSLSLIIIFFSWSLHGCVWMVLILFYFFCWVCSCFWSFSLWFRVLFGCRVDCRWQVESEWRMMVAVLVFHFRNVNRHWLLLHFCLFCSSVLKCILFPYLWLIIYSM